MLSTNLFFSNDIPFTSFSVSHLGAVVVFIACLLVFAKSARQLSDHQNLLLTRAASIFLSLTVIAWTAIHLAYGRFDAAFDLPLSICNLFAVAAPMLFWQPNRKRFEIVYFFVLAGTLQAIITPDPDGGFPSYGFFKYWFVHCGLVAVVVHHLLAFDLYPQARGILRTFGWLNIYILCLIPINLWLGSNYFYMMNKPVNPSLLDYFGPWPIYILVTECLAMGFFAVAYLPIFWTRKLRTKMATIDSTETRNLNRE
jgi:hypothetical integral membrane protein (TIGR02206 family)